MLILWIHTDLCYQQYVKMSSVISVWVSKTGQLLNTIYSNNGFVTIIYPNGLIICYWIWQRGSDRCLLTPPYQRCTSSPTNPAQHQRHMSKPSLPPSPRYLLNGCDGDVLAVFAVTAGQLRSVSAALQLAPRWRGVRSPGPRADGGVSGADVDSQRSQTVFGQLHSHWA